MKRIILGVLLLAAPLLAQPSKTDRITKLVTLRNTDPRAIQNLVSQFGVNVMSNDQMKTMTINGTADQLAAAEAVIKQLDLAPKTVELTVYFVVGGDQAGNVMGGAVPQGPARCDHATQGRVHVQGLQDAGCADAAHEGRIVGGNLGHSEQCEPLRRCRSSPFAIRR